jgi:hypothetical protein
MGEIIMNKELKKKLGRLIENCTDGAMDQIHCPENVAIYAKAAASAAEAIRHLSWFAGEMEDLSSKEEDDSEFKVVSIGDDGNKLGVVLRGRSEYLTDEYKKWIEGCEYPDHEGFKLVEKLGENKGATSDLTLTFFKVH